MAVDLFAGIPVNDYAAALAWYQRLRMAPPQGRGNLYWQPALGGQTATGRRGP
jgi:hypothetical protein